MSKQFKDDLNAFFTVFKQFVVAILSARAGTYKQKKSPDGDFSFIDKLFGTHPKLELRRHLYTHIER